MIFALSLNRPVSETILYIIIAPTGKARRPADNLADIASPMTIASAIIFPVVGYMYHRIATYNATTVSITDSASLFMLPDIRI